MDDHELKIELTFDPKNPMPILDRKCYDSKIGLFTFVKDLQSLWMVIFHRQGFAQRQKRLGQDDPLNFFVLFGKYYLDQNGIFCELEAVSPPREEASSMPVLKLDEFVRMFEVERLKFVAVKFPYPGDVCLGCGKEFTYDQIQDFRHIDFHGEKCCYHASCEEAFLYKKQLEEFDTLMGLNFNPRHLHFTAIPNEFSSNKSRSPWFLVKTPDGDMKLGWINNVLHIEWLDSYRSFTETFDEIDTIKQLGPENPATWTRDELKEFISDTPKFVPVFLDCSSIFEEQSVWERIVVDILVKSGFDVSFQKPRRFIHARNIDEALDIISRASGSVE